MFKYFVANDEIYRVNLERQEGNYFHLNESRLEDGDWTPPISIGMKGKGLTLEKAMKKIYAFPVYYDSVREAKRVANRI